MDLGPSTRSVHAGIPDPVQGAPLIPPPVLAAPFHLRGAADSAPYGYGRDHNPSWTALEAALGSLDGGESVIFGSGMAAVTAVLMAFLRSGDTLVGGPRRLPRSARARAAPEGAGREAAHGPPDTAELCAAADGARLVFMETPSNPKLDVVDIAEVARACRDSGALLAVDNTVCTPLGQQPLALGADLARCPARRRCAGTTTCCSASCRRADPERAEALREWRTQSGSIPGGFEAWLAHRSLATLGLRLERCSANAAAVAAPDARARHEVAHPSHPQMAFAGPLVSFTLESAERAQAFFDACALVTEATSFGGVHSTAERRARWGTDDVPEGFVRFSAGCEDTEDLVADVARALDATG